MTRNRDETRQRLLDAALAILTEEGFSALGINAIARRAGTDKQLIYRYFGGLDALMEAAGTEVAERMGAALSDRATRPCESYGAMMEQLANALFEQLSEDALYRQLRLMEASAPSPATMAFRAARGAVLGAWMAQTRGNLRPPEGLDAPSINALIIAAIEGATILGPVGMERGSAEARARLSPALLHLVRGAYGVA